MEQFNTVIIGGGPAGLMAAKELINLGETSVALIEKSTAYADSVACGEGVWKDAFEKLIDPNPNWIRLEITRASFDSADDSQVILGDGSEVQGYILDRALFQEDLLAEVTSKITVLRGVSVKAVENGEEQTVQLSDGKTLTCTTLIDASGPASTFSKPYGIYSKPDDLEPACYAIVENVDYDSSTVHLRMCSHFGSGGYAWEFPRTKSSVNVGIVMGKDFKGTYNLKDRVAEFVEKQYPGGKITEWRAGSIPCYSNRKTIAAPGFLQVGDAAAMVNPLTRSGISESMKLGKIAAQYAIKMNGAATESLKRSAALEYEKAVWNDYAKKIEKVAKVKDELYKITDKEFNGAAHELGKLPQESITMLKILTITIKKSPKLLWAMRHLL